MRSLRARMQPKVWVVKKQKDIAFVLRFLHYLNMVTLISKISRPLSSGFLRLALTNVNANPVVRFNYFNNPVEMERCMNGMRKIAKILGSRALRVSSSTIVSGSQTSGSFTTTKNIFYDG